MNGNDVPSAHNHASDGTNFVQAHTVFGGVHFHDQPAAQGSPIIVSVQVPVSILVVDGSPPRPMPWSRYTKVIVTVEARSGARTVILQDMRPVVVERRKPQLATV